MPARQAGTPGLSRAEWKIMNVVWERHPASAREILDALGDETGWAYTTLKTILSRLVDKGALTEGKRGNRSLYRPLLTRRRARRQAVRSLLDRAFDGTFGTLLHYLADEQRLGPEERRQLREVMDGDPAAARPARRRRGPGGGDRKG